jgi:hypothetical protein
MRKVITKEEMTLLKEAGEMFDETGCVPGIDGEQVPAERMVPEAKEYILESIDDPEATYDPEIWDTTGFTLVLFWLAQKWQERCHRLAHRRTKGMSRLGRNRIDPRNHPTAAVELRYASDALEKGGHKHGQPAMSFPMGRTQCFRQESAVPRGRSVRSVVTSDRFERSPWCRPGNLT